MEKSSDAEQAVPREPTPEESAEALRRFNESGMMAWLRLASQAIFFTVLLLPITLVVLLVTIWRGPSAPFQGVAAAITVGLGFAAVLTQLLAYGVGLKRSGGLCIGTMNFGGGKGLDVSPFVLLALLVVLSGSLGYAAFSEPWRNVFLIPVLLVAYARVKLGFLFR